MMDTVECYLIKDEMGMYHDFFAKLWMSSPLNATRFYDLDLAKQYLKEVVERSPNIKCRLVRAHFAYAEEDI